jgi:tetratricopeptide (TPR) repeat protein
MQHALSSQVAFQARDYSAAVEHARQAIVLDPEFWIAYVQIAQAYEPLGKTATAIEALNNAGRFSERNSKALSLRGYLLAKLGRADEARDVLRTLEEVARNRYVPPYAMALVHAGLGERDAVFEWLDRAYATRDAHLQFLTVDPKWDPYRAAPPIRGSPRALWVHAPTMILRPAFARELEATLRASRPGGFATSFEVRRSHKSKQPYF